MQLDPGSWLELIPGWLAGADALFAYLLDALPWEQRKRPMFEQMVLEPRLTAEVHCLANAPHPGLRHAADALSTRYGVRYDNLWLNLYRDGQDSTAWHGDRFSCRRELCTVRCSRSAPPPIPDQASARAARRRRSVRPRGT